MPNPHRPAVSPGLHFPFRLNRCRLLTWLLPAAFALANLPFPTSLASPLSVGVFITDATPPVGHPLCGGWIQPLETVDDPLLAKGIVLVQGTDRFAICALDWCLLQTGAYELFRRKIATAIDAPESHVTIHTVHQHNAPIADVNAQHLLDAVESAPLHLDLEFIEAVTDRLAESARTAMHQLQSVTHAGHGKARVARFASNRRVRLHDGRIHARYSASRDPELRAAPEGLIDPWLRTVTLFDRTTPLVRLHYYATHPMSYYGDGRATADTVGLARERLEREENVPQIYFTGCAGNVTAGKYNDGSPESRVALTDRVHQAMREAVKDTTIAPVHGIDWKTTPVRFAPRTEDDWTEGAARRRLGADDASDHRRLQAALDLAWIQHTQRTPDILLSRLRLGPITILHLPAESFIEYQLYAQSLRPDDFIAVAAYGESGPGYICCDAALAEGGYEPTMSRVGPPSEFRYKKAIAELVAAPSPSPDPPFYPDKLRLLAYRDNDGVEHPVTTPAEWARRKSHVLAAMQQVMGPHPAEADRVPLDLQVLEELRLPGYRRLKVSFAVRTDDRVPAWLLIPHERAEPGPAMLCLHQTVPAGKAEPAGLSDDPNLHYGHELAERGYVVLAPDYPNFGEYQVDSDQLGYASTTMHGIWNHRRAIDLLAALPEVDPDRIGVMGHSLGGHNALFLAAFEPRVRAIITSCGFNSFFHYQQGDLSGWSHAGYMPRIASRFESDPKQMPFDFTEVLAVIAPRPVFVHAPRRDLNFPLPGVFDCLAAAKPVYHLFNAPDRLTAVHPDVGHEFPSEIRQAAYRWLDQQWATP
jgi:pimeloyl-ACP methyl ester carboxylesterase